MPMARLAARGLRMVKPTLTEHAPRYAEKIAWGNIRSRSAIRESLPGFDKRIRRLHALALCENKQGIDVELGDVVLQVYRQRRQPHDRINQGIHVRARAAARPRKHGVAGSLL